MGKVALYFANERLISVRLVATSQEDARQILTDKYGPPQLPDATAQKSDRRFITSHSWSFTSGASISLQPQQTGKTEVVYMAPHWDSEANY